MRDGYRRAIATLAIGFLACLAWIAYSNTLGRGRILLDQSQTHEKLWQANSITDYRIVTRIRQPIAYPQRLTYATTVRNGQITNQTCLSAQCEYISTQHISTVPELFSTVRDLSRASVERFLFAAGPCLSVEFDERYHFPKLIDFDCPNVIDDEITIDVQQFEILK